MICGCAARTRRRGGIEVIPTARLAGRTLGREWLERAGSADERTHALMYAWVCERIKGILGGADTRGHVVLDAGCAEADLHRELEKELGLGIIGLMRRGENDSRGRRDACVDLDLDSCGGNQFFFSSVDAVFWCDSLCVCAPADQKAEVDESLRALKPGGLFMALFRLAAETAQDEASGRWVLSPQDARDVFGVDWSVEPDVQAAIRDHGDGTRAFSSASGGSGAFGPPAYGIGAASFIRL